jgi:hypothetical protein
MPAVKNARRREKSGMPQVSSGSSKLRQESFPDVAEMWCFPRKEVVEMHTAYLVITLVFAVMVSYSGVGKIRRDPLQVRVIHETVGVPLKYFALLAACEFAGALGLVVGIWWPLIGMAAGIGLVLYFVGAIVSHLRVGDVKGSGSAAFMLVLAAGAIALRMLTK